MLTAPPAPRPEPPTSTEKELRSQLCAFVRRSYQQRLMVSTQGAFSARLDPEVFLITPHRADRSTLDVSDIVLVRGDAAELGKTPSSAAVNHRAIYAAHPRIRAIVTAYPVNATAFSVTSADLDTRTIPESYVFLRETHRVPYGVQFGDGRELAAMTDLANPALIFENDGVQVCGASVLDAFDRLEVLEATAEAMINSRSLGDMVPMPESAIVELKAAFPGA
jgi:L-fuculose-phosphate aldolase